MFKKYKNIFYNKFINIAGLLAIFLSPFADALGGAYAFWVLSAFLFSLFVYGFYDEQKKYKKFQEDVVHVPIVIKIDNGPNEKYVMKNILKIIENDYNLDNYEEDLKNYFSLELDTLVFKYHGNIYNFDELMSFIRIIQYKLHEIEHQLNGRVKFHIAYYKRPSIGFLIGILFRTEGIVVYQNNDFEDTFEKVANINSRKYKERIDNYSKYQVIEHSNNQDNDTVLLVINSASHFVNLKANNLQKYENIIEIRLKENGTIDYNTDWTIYANEIYNLINKLQTEYQQITIAHSMPEAISVILGMALENYWNINITQYENNDYKDVFTMNKAIFYS